MVRLQNKAPGRERRAYYIGKVPVGRRVGDTVISGLDWSQTTSGRDGCPKRLEIALIRIRLGINVEFYQFINQRDSHQYCRAVLSPCHYE